MEADERAIGPNKKTSILSLEEEEKLLTSPAQSTGLAEAKVGKIRPSGAPRKCLRYHLGQGHSIEEARRLAQQPMNLKRQRSSNTTPEQSSFKRAIVVERASVAAAAEGAREAVPNPEVRESTAKI